MDDWLPLLAPLESGAYYNSLGSASFRTWSNHDDPRRPHHVL
jgi:hypothetical protein